MDFEQAKLQVARRTFLGQTAAGLGAAALGSVLNAAAPEAVTSDRWQGVVRPLHMPAKAKRVIFLCMAGGPSHLETFDYKPKLAEMDGKPMPESFTKGQPIAQLQGKALKCLGPQHVFKKCGKKWSAHQHGLASHQRKDRGRYLHCELARYQSDQSRSGSHVYEHGNDDFRAAEHGGVVVVWARKRLRRPAGVYRVGFRWRRSESADRVTAVAQRSFAESLSRCAVSFGGRSRPLFESSCWCDNRSATRRRRCRPENQPVAQRQNQRP